MTVARKLLANNGNQTKENLPLSIAGHYHVPKLVDGHEMFTLQTGNGSTKGGCISGLKLSSDDVPDGGLGDTEHDDADGCEDDDTAVVVAFYEERVTEGESVVDHVKIQKCDETGDDDDN